MNKEQQRLLDEVYRKYADSHKYFVDGWLHVIPMYHSKETFVNECKTDTEFSEKWGLKIEERELSLNDRILEFAKRDLNPSEFRQGGDYGTVIPEEKTLKVLDRHNIPTKLITITYNNKTIESYENNS
jgi:hypothetical protein